MCEIRELLLIALEHRVLHFINAKPRHFSKLVCVAMSLLPSQSELQQLILFHRHTSLRNDCTCGGCGRLSRGEFA
jgi:hypothetical protein